MIRRASSRDLSNTFFTRLRSCRVIVIMAIFLSDDEIYAGLCSIKPGFINFAWELSFLLYRVSIELRVISVVSQGHVCDLDPAAKRVAGVSV